MSDEVKEVTPKVPTEIISAWTKMYKWIKDLPGEEMNDE